MAEQEGWTSPVQHQKQARPALACRHAAVDGRTPRRFLSAILPTPGPVAETPWTLHSPTAEPGADRVEIHLSRPGDDIVIWRDLATDTCGLDTVPPIGSVT
jgi:hypothetical protein